MPDLGISGLASGFDWRSLVDQLAEVERAPQRRLRTEQTQLQQRNNAYASIATQLGVLNSRVIALKEPSLFDSRRTVVSDTTRATATAQAGASLGSYTLNVTQRATASVRQGAGNAGAALNATNDVSAVLLGNAGFATAATPGTFTVNGKTITVASTDTLQAVFDRISSATSGAVTAAYDATTDKITFNGVSEIVLGSANDTSNFLLVSKLSNNGTASVISSASLGAIRTSASLSNANFATAISDGGSGAGKFRINGVEITFNGSADTVADVLQRINNSDAGVTASYDPVNDRFQLTNKTTGDVGVGLEDVTGNFLAATGLAAGTLERGKDLLYTINNGGQLISHSNTISESSSGLSGLSVTVLDEGTFTVEVASDSSRIKAALSDFITEYNRIQSLIDTNTASSTDAQGHVTADTLAGESDAYDIASRLRNLVNAQLSGFSSAIKQLAGLGIDSNGDDDTLALRDSGKLDDALANNLGAVKDLFSHSTLGLAVSLHSYLETIIGNDGSLVSKQSNLVRQSSDIDIQVTEQERHVQVLRDQMIASFVAMEQARAQINQQLQFLSQRFGTTSS